MLMVKRIQRKHRRRIVRKVFGRQFTLNENKTIFYRRNGVEYIVQLHNHFCCVACLFSCWALRFLRFFSILVVAQKRAPTLMTRRFVSSFFLLKEIFRVIFVFHSMCIMCVMFFCHGSFSFILAVISIICHNFALLHSTYFMLTWVCCECFGTTKSIGIKAIRWFKWKSFRTPRIVRYWIYQFQWRPCTQRYRQPFGTKCTTKTVNR